MLKFLTCRPIRHSLPDYVTHRLSSSENARIERHLAACPDCAAERHALARAVELAELARQAPLPSSLSTWSDLRAQIQAGAVPATAPRNRFGLLALGAVVAVGVAAAALSVFIPPLVRHNAQEVVKQLPLKGAAPIALQNKLSQSAPRGPVQAKEGAVGHLPHVVFDSQVGDRRRTTIGAATDYSKGFATAPQGDNGPLERVAEAVQQVGPGQVGQDTALVKSLQKKPGANQSIGENFGAAGQSAVPGIRALRSGDSELAYLNPDPETSLAPWTQRPPDTIRRLEERLEQQVKGGDNFVTVPLPTIVGQGPAAIKSAVAAHDKEAAIVDARLVREIALRQKAVAFADLCQFLTTETGIRFTANRRVAADKVTIFCHPRSLRSIMRLIAQHFGFAWVRKGEEGAYEYELTQTLRSQLLEEGLRDKDQEEMLIAIDRQMERFRKYRGMSLDQINAIKMTRENANEMLQLRMGGLVPMNQFFGLSGAEVDALRAGQTLSLDLLGREPAGLPSNLAGGIWHSFDESYGRERKAVQERGGSTSYIPDHPTRLIASLKLDRSKPGEFVLKGGLSDQQTGLVSSLAVAKSPAITVENAKSNAKLAADPDLQHAITMKPVSTCRLDSTPYPDTESLYEHKGDKLTTADVLQALFDETGIDILSDYFSRLQDPAAVSSQGSRLFAALNQIGDRMKMRWTKTGAKKEAWLQFRTSTFYYDRPQEIPNRLLERWKALRKKQGVMSPEDLAEVGQLPDAQLDSIWMAQAAIAVYGLEEWQMGRIAQVRPHWRFLGKLSDAQRRDVWTAKGLEYGELSAELQNQFLSLAYDGDADRPGRHQVRSASLRGHYAFATHPLQYGGSYAVLQSNPLLFVYTSSTGEDPNRMAIVGPWNGIYGMRTEMLKPDAYSIVR